MDDYIRHIDEQILTGQISSQRGLALLDMLDVDPLQVHLVMRSVW